MTPILFEKSCPSCKETRAISEFHKDKRNKTGYTSWCNVCRRKNAKKWVKENPDKAYRSRRNTCLKRNYNITLQEYESLLVAQNHSCAICKTKSPGGRGGIFVVDHCHKTNVVRKLLCTKCNCAIGLLNEDPKLFEAAKNYIKEYYAQVNSYGEQDEDLI